MKKLLVFLSVVTCIFSMVGFAQAIPSGVTNLLDNGSFEVFTPGPDWADWSEGGEWYLDSGRAYDGTYAARLGAQNGNLYQSFSIIDGDTLYFGAYFSIITNEFAGNWDQTQINMQIAGLPDTTIGGDVNSYQSGLTWSFVGGSTYISDWFLVSGMVDISGITLPANSAININLQNYDTANTRVIVDGAYAGVAPVPEPSTILLLGAGLLGLGAYSRKRNKK